MRLDQCNMHSGPEPGSGRPWKWGGGSVASAEPAPRYEFNEPIITMLPCVLCVYVAAMAGSTCRSKAASIAYSIPQFSLQRCP